MIKYDQIIGRVLLDATSKARLYEPPVAQTEFAQKRFVDFRGRLSHVFIDRRLLRYDTDAHVVRSVTPIADWLALSAMKTRLNRARESTAHHHQFLFARFSCRVRLK